jgi:hypothetical protein
MTRGMRKSPRVFCEPCSGGIQNKKRDRQDLWRASKEEQPSNLERADLGMLPV